MKTTIKKTVIVVILTTVFLPFLRSQRAMIPVKVMICEKLISEKALFVHQSLQHDQMQLLPASPIYVIKIRCTDVSEMFLMDEVQEDEPILEPWMWTFGDEFLKENEPEEIPLEPWMYDTAYWK